MRNKLNTQRLEICITPLQKARLKRLAEKQEKTVNEFIRDIIRNFLIGS